MNQKALDQEWRKLQAHIEGFMGRTVESDVQKIEYKPRFALHLLEMPTEMQQNDIQKMNL